MKKITKLISKSLRKLKIKPKLISQIRNIYHLIIIIKSPLYDSSYYKEKNDDLKGLSNLELLKHFHQNGYKENRNPSEKFSILRYYRLRPDVKLLGVNPLVHYELFGKKEGVWLTKNSHNERQFIEWEDNFQKLHRKTTAIKKNVQLFAYYLPQYHNDTWNNKFWGRVSQSGRMLQQRDHCSTHINNQKFHFMAFTTYMT